MKARRFCELALLVGSLLFAAEAQAQLKDLPIDRGVEFNLNKYRENPQVGGQFFEEAKRLAVQKKDVKGLLWIAAIYLHYRWEKEAVWFFDQAVRCAGEWASDKRPNSEQNRDYGQKALCAVVEYYNTTLRQMAASQETRKAVYDRAVWAGNNVQALNKPCGGGSGGGGGDKKADCAECTRRCSEACKDATVLLCVVSGLGDGGERCQQCIDRCLGR